MVFYTVGHSTRPLPEFIAMLRHAGVSLVVDVRSIPRSRTNPAYDRDALPRPLDAAGIRYAHIAELGGRRSRAHDVPDACNAFWRNRSFHNYADHAQSETFAAGLARLLQLGATHVPAIMCAEAVWWRCHRRIIADFLLHRGAEVYHLMDAGRATPAVLTPAARPAPGGGLVYPADAG